MRQVTAADIDELVRRLEDVQSAADVLIEQLRGSGREEGAVDVREIAAYLVKRARAGSLATGRTALPLSRPFSEWSYGAAAEPVWQAIDEVQRVWEARFDEGDFEVSG
jgi:hypothetical protein